MYLVVLQWWDPVEFNGEMNSIIALIVSTTIAKEPIVSNPDAIENK